MTRFLETTQLRLFRVLLRVYPTWFRHMHAQEMDSPAPAGATWLLEVDDAIF